MASRETYLALGGLVTFGLGGGRSRHDFAEGKMLWVGSEVGGC